MIPRERIRKALNYEEVNKIPVDFGGTEVTGIHVTALDKLIQKLGLKQRIVKAFEPMMMLGFVDQDVIEAMGGDIIGLFSPHTVLGYKNENWKEWRLPNGTKVLMGGGFNYVTDKDGTVYTYPEGDISLKPSAKMPSTGFYFDPIPRQGNLSKHNFDAREDYKEQYTVLSEDVLNYLEKESERLFNETNLSVFGNWWGGGLGDFLMIPGEWLRETPGIRKLEDWIVATIDHPDYVHDFFDLQVEIALKNLELYHQAVGERIDIIAVSGTDFGTQNGPFMSIETYCEFYKKRHKIMCDWIHENTNWKVFFHSCGDIYSFLDDFIEIGVDIINPVQYTAKDMDLKTLKEKYDKKIIFYGGGINTQKTLQFNTPEEVREETKNNVKILSAGGGFICAAVHNIQGSIPADNIIAFFESIND